MNEITVTNLSACGGGVPDLLIGYSGKNYLAEVKNPLQSKRDQRLTPAQNKYHLEWRGQVSIIRYTAELLEIINYMEEQGGSGNTR